MIQKKIKSNDSTQKHQASTRATYLYILIYVHAYILRGSWCKKPRYCEEILLVALWSLESKMFGKWSQIYTLDVTKFKFIILFVDSLNVQVFCKNSLFCKMYKLNAI